MMSATRSHAAAVILLTVALCGCETGGIVSTATWQAELTHNPGSACVDDTVGGLVSSAGSRQWEAQEQHFTIPASGPGIRLIAHQGEIKMLLTVQEPREHRVTFTLEYADPFWRRSQADRLAQSIIAGIATHCGVPELQERAKLRRGRGAAPAMTIM